MVKCLNSNISTVISRFFTWEEFTLESQSSSMSEVACLLLLDSPSKLAANYSYFAISQLHPAVVYLVFQTRICSSIGRFLLCNSHSAITTADFVHLIEVLLSQAIAQGVQFSQSTLLWSCSHTGFLLEQCSMAYLYSSHQSSVTCSFVVGFLLLTDLTCSWSVNLACGAIYVTVLPICSAIHALRWYCFSIFGFILLVSQ